MTSVAYEWTYELSRVVRYHSSLLESLAHLGVAPYNGPNGGSFP